MEKKNNDMFLCKMGLQNGQIKNKIKYNKNYFMLCQCEKLYYLIYMCTILDVIYATIITVFTL